MSAPRCLVVGAGRIAGGFVAPLLRAAGWDVALVCRNATVLEALRASGGLWLRLGAEPDERWVGGIDAAAIDDLGLPRLVRHADLIATAVGPNQLAPIGRLLGPLLQRRWEASDIPLNVITFENHRRGPELLAAGLLDVAPELAGAIGARLGIGGAAVWRAVSHRVVADDGLHFRGDDVDECYVDAASLVAGAPPCDGTLPGLDLVRAFDDRMVEKLWVFNAGHAAAAYLGWHAGCPTLDVAMKQPKVRSAVAAVVREAQQAFAAYLAMRPASVPIPPRPPEWVLDRYADALLNDPVARVGREPRRKLAAGDRLIGPAVAAMAGGFEPVALALASAAALAYAEPSDPQAADLQRELELVGPSEVLGAVSMLEPSERLVDLIGGRYRDRAFRTATP